MGNVGGVKMRFAIAKTDYWKLKGFDVTEWRKSEDGELALVHDSFARMLLPDLDNDNNVKIYPFDSEELKEVIDGYFTIHQYEDEEVE